MPRLEVGDITIYYETHGKGEPLVLIMGLGGGSSTWWRQVAFFSTQYQVITYDSRGVGRTDKPDVPYSMGMLADDAAGLLEKLGITSAHVYGVSMGGMVAQELALRYPKLVSSLILGATACGGKHSIRSSPEATRRLFSLMTLPPKEAMSVSISLTFSAAFVKHHPDRINEWLLKVAESPPSPVGYRRQIEAVVGFDSGDKLQQIRSPTLIIAGNDDQLIPAENSSILASRIPDAELVLFDGVGHGYLWEVEEEANRAVLDFLRRHPIA